MDSGKVWLSNGGGGGRPARPRPRRQWRSRPLSGRVAAASRVLEGLREEKEGGGGEVGVLPGGEGSE